MLGCIEWSWEKVFMKKMVIVALGGLGIIAATSGTAFAGLEFCNQTDLRVQISVAYNDKGKGSWVSEGWWGLDPGECYVPTPLKGDLKNRYYYYYAKDGDGGYWGGDPDEGYMYCTDSQPFTIHGDACASRGYTQRSFEEVDTGKTAKHYTVDLTD